MKSRIASGLLGLVLLAMGVTQGATDESLLKYHNQFVKEAYNGVVAKGWDPFVHAMQAENATPSDMAEYVKTKLQPELKKWSTQAATVETPEFAKEFHGKFSANLKKVADDSKVLLTSLEEEDTETMTKTLGEMNPLMHQLDADVAAFQKKLKDERDFKFE